MAQAEKEYKNKMEQLAGNYMVADTGLINAYSAHKSTCQSIRGRSAPAAVTCLCLWDLPTTIRICSNARICSNPESRLHTLTCTYIRADT